MCVPSVQGDCPVGLTLSWALRLSALLLCSALLALQFRMSDTVQGPHSKYGNVNNEIQFQLIQLSFPFLSAENFTACKTAIPKLLPTLESKNIPKQTFNDLSNQYTGLRLIYFKAQQ